MTTLDEAVARYHRLIVSEPLKDGEWARQLEVQLRAAKLNLGGGAICPAVRPQFITRRQYETLVKAAEALYSAMQRAHQLALASPALLARMELLPAEKMLAALDPGYPHLPVTSVLDRHSSNGSHHFVECNSDAPPGIASSEALSNLFYDCAPVKALRKRFKLTKLGGVKPLLKALLGAYRVSGKKRFPAIAILEFRQPFQAGQSREYLLLAEHFRQLGYPTEVISPEQLEYRAGVLRRGDFAIDLIYRRVSVQQLLVRFDLSHPLVQAYREGAVCVVNSFRAELAHKKAIFDLLTDETITAGFPTAERRVLHEHIPWTRVVAATKTNHGRKTVDLPEFILKNREKLVLKPNDDGGEQSSYQGWEMDDAGWERALRNALRNPYVVQQRVAPARALFPILQSGQVEMKELQVALHPHVFLGRVEGCSSWLSDATTGFSTLAGLAPTFILESR